MCPILTLTTDAHRYGVTHSYTGVVLPLPPADRAEGGQIRIENPFRKL